MRYLDTSVLVPLFVPEGASERIQGWFEMQEAGGLAISDWTLTEFSSALGLKVRAKALKDAQAKVAVAHNAGAEAVFSLDRKFIAAGRRLKIRTTSPI